MLNNPFFCLQRITIYQLRILYERVKKAEKNNRVDNEKMLGWTILLFLAGVVFEKFSVLITKISLVLFSQDQRCWKLI